MEVYLKNWRTDELQASEVKGNYLNDPPNYLITAQFFPQLRNDQIKPEVQ
jgi:hypothetical protein